MPKDTSYIAKSPDANGMYHYTAEETETWAHLFDRQMAVLPGIASRAWLEGLTLLGISTDALPQVAEIDARLSRISGAGVEGVPALIPQDRFARLLAARKFPVATFIRRPEHIDYIEEPDIFHEVFGHAPMLTNRAFGDVLESFGRLALSLPEDDLPHLFRLFWFAVEFGLVRENGDRRIFGAGILSSPGETAAAMAPDAVVEPFDALTVLRTPYRIDIVQPVYFMVEDIADLAAVMGGDVAGLIARAREAGDLPARFDPA